MDMKVQVKENARQRRYGKVWDTFLSDYGNMSLIECIRWSRYGMAIAIVLTKVGVCLDSR